MATVRPDEYLGEKDLADFLDGADRRGRCGSCRYWSEHEPPTWCGARAQEIDRLLNEVLGMRGQPPDVTARVRWEGQCRRHAPTRTLGDLGPEENPGDPRAVWPETDWRDWCGDHEEAP